MSIFSVVWNSLCGNHLAQLKKDAEEGGREVSRAAQETKGAAGYVSHAATGAIISAANVVQIADEALMLLDNTRRTREQSRANIS